MAENQSMLPRGLQAGLEEALEDTPVVCLLGPMGILPTGDDRFLGVPISKLWEL